MKAEIREILEKHGLTSSILSDATDHSDQATEQIISLFLDMLPEEKYDPTKHYCPDEPDEYKRGKTRGHNDCLSEIKAKLEGK